MTDSLASFQAAFFDAVLAIDKGVRPPAYVEQPGFAVYRNTVMSGCIDALQANYPTVREMVGDERFRELARAFVRATPPRDGVLAGYGAGFAASLGHDGGVDERGLLCAVAALDRCWTESHLAADAPVLLAGELAALSPQRFAAARLVPHPAARWMRFEAMPAFTLWRRIRERVPGGVPLPRQAASPSALGGESALLTRPVGAVTWRAIEAASAAFLTACAARYRVADAIERVAEAGLGDDIAAWLPGLMQARAFTRVANGASG